MAYQAQRMPLVGVEPSLHQHDRDPVQSSKEESGNVAGDGGHREVGDLVVGKDVAVLEQASQSG